MGTLSRAPVSERAVVARINRALAKDNRTLRTTRADSRWYSNTGRHYVIDIAQNCILWTDVDLEELGRELGVLADYETIAD